jgi:hypothetical protein
MVEQEVEDLVVLILELIRQLLQEQTTLVVVVEVVLVMMDLQTMLQVEQGVQEL